MVVERDPKIPLTHPLVDLDNQGFWDAARRHELVFQRCSKCQHLLHPPRPMCPYCLSTDLRWVPSTGRGRIYTWTTVEYDRIGFPGFKVPYAIIVVEMEEGTRVISNPAGMKPEEIYAGMPVEVVFEDLEPGLTLFKFKKRES